LIFLGNIYKIGGENVFSEETVFVQCENQWLVLCQGQVMAVGDEYEEALSRALTASLI